MGILTDSNGASSLQELFGEIRKAARYFEKYHYPKTSRLIICLVEKIDKQNGTFELEALAQEIILLSQTLKNEFELILPFGQDYRRRCFGEVWAIVISAFSVGESEQKELLVETNRFMKCMHDIKRRIAPTNDLFIKLFNKPTRSHRESLVMFNSACQAYMISVEGVFGELAKTLYCFLEIIGRDNPKYEVITRQNVWGILRGCKQLFGITPVFLENWEETSHIRNAIAHAQAKFSPKNNKIRFFTKDLMTTNILYDRTMSFEDFFLRYFELMDAIDSFYYAIELFRIMNLLKLAYLQRADTTR